MKLTFVPCISCKRPITKTEDPLCQECFNQAIIKWVLEHPEVKEK